MRKLICKIFGHKPAGEPWWADHNQRMEWICGRCYEVFELKSEREE